MRYAVDMPERDVGDLSASVAKCGHALEYVLESDPTKEAYWDELHPVL